MAYGSDLSQVHALLSGLLAKNQLLLKDPPPFVVAKAFSESSVDFELFFWVHTVRETYTAKSALIMEVTAAFNEAGIRIPFPQRDVHFFNEDTEGRTA
ncbi:mechanosensitive ion channel [Chitinophaga horti]|uniref:Mechanosensitive ion channel n=1 Tax=Chitinophaga horti TaxID=2920382 RepID=A0ABY6J7A7_9BACT|nr:mechanosensitive ion channel domain-containing protein [Chitinophaga horti]UYQ95569.1 mechanosensitive ion channel [Chitinophaga horti]